MTDSERAQEKVNSMQDRLNEETRDLARQQEKVDTAEKNLKEAQIELTEIKLKESEEETKRLAEAAENLKKD